MRVPDQAQRRLCELRLKLCEVQLIETASPLCRSLCLEGELVHRANHTPIRGSSEGYLLVPMPVLRDPPWRRSEPLQQRGYARAKRRQGGSERAAGYQNCQQRGCMDKEHEPAAPKRKGNRVGIPFPQRRRRGRNLFASNFNVLEQPVRTTDENQVADCREFRNA